MSCNVLIVTERSSSVTRIAEALKISGESKRHGDYITFTSAPKPNLPSLPCHPVNTIKIICANGNVFKVKVPSSGGGGGTVEGGTVDALLHPSLVVLEEEAGRSNVANHVTETGADCTHVVFAFDNDRKSEHKCYQLWKNCLTHITSEQHVYRVCLFGLSATAIGQAFKKCLRLRPSLAQAWEVSADVNARVGSCFSNYMAKVFQGRYPTLGASESAISYGAAMTPALNICSGSVQKQQKPQPQPKTESNTLLAATAPREGQLCITTSSHGTFLCTAPITQSQELLKKIRHSKMNCLNVRAVQYPDEISCKAVSAVQAMNTALLLSLCCEEHNFNPRHTMSLADTLYEEGYITYPRTTATAYPLEYSYTSIAASLKSTFTLAHLFVPVQVPIPAGEPWPILPLNVDRITTRYMDRADKWKVLKTIVKYMFGEMVVDSNAIITADIANVQFVATETKPAFLNQMIAIEKMFVVTKDHAARHTTPSQAIAINKQTAKTTTTTDRTIKEPEIVQILCENGMGADGAAAAYLGTIYERKYAIVDTEGEVHLTNLGLVLLEGLRKINPRLVGVEIRNEFEQLLQSIERGQSTATSLDEMKEVTLRQYRELFAELQRNIHVLTSEMDKAFNPQVALQMASTGGDYKLLLQQEDCGPTYADLCKDVEARNSAFPMYDAEHRRFYVFGSASKSKDIVEHWEHVLFHHSSELTRQVSYVVAPRKCLGAKMSEGFVLQGYEKFDPDLTAQVRIVFDSAMMMQSFLKETTMDTANVEYNRPRQLLTVQFRKPYFLLHFLRMVEKDPRGTVVNMSPGKVVEITNNEALPEGSISRGYEWLSQRSHWEQVVEIRNAPLSVKAEGVRLLLQACGLNKAEFTITRGTVSSTISVKPMAKGGCAQLKTFAANDSRMYPSAHVVGLPQKNVTVVTFALAQEALTFRSNIATELRIPDANAAVVHDVVIPGWPESAPSYPTEFLSQLCQTLKDSFGCSVQVVHSMVKSCVLRIKDGRTVNAATYITSQLQPTKLTSKDPALSHLISSWQQGNVSAGIQSAVAKQNVYVRFTEGNIESGEPMGTIVNLYGAPACRGAVLAAIGVEYQRLLSLVTDVPVDSSSQLFFLDASQPGTQWLQAMNAKHGDDDTVVVRFDPKSKCVRVVGATPAEAKDLTDAVRSQLLTFRKSVAPSADAVMVDKKCWCGSAATGTLSRCGHGYCSTCFRDQLQNRSDAKQPICCQHKHVDETAPVPILMEDFTRELSQEEIENFILLSMSLGSTGRVPCGRDGCDGFLVKSGFMECPRCRNAKCVSCNTTDDNHSGLVCEEYKTLLTLPPDQAKAFLTERVRKLTGIFETVASKAKDFVAKNWLLSMQSYSDFLVTVNECLKHETPACPCRAQFLEGLSRVGGAAVLKNPDSHLFAWHGTGSMAAVNGICHDSWDVGRRSGQVYGRGEYFGESAAVSHGYSGSSGQMIVSLLLTGPFLKHVDGFCYVVDNPLGERVRYCLPVLVVSYMSKLPPVFHPPSTTVVAGGSGGNGTASFPPPVYADLPFRFQWKDDQGAWQDYNQRLSVDIEEAYQAYKKDPKACVRRLHQVVRWLDDVPQDYDMDFSKCVQINCATKYQRSIQRVPVVQFGNQKRLWQYYCPDTNAWCPYDGQVQSAIHRLFEEYRKGGYGIVKLRMPGRPEEYEINFVRGEQRNVTTGVSRKIQMT